MAPLYDPALHDTLVWTTFGLAGVTLAILLLISAPYGRHARAGWGPTIPSRAAWILMELPAVAVFGAFYLTGQHRAELVPLVLLGIWQLHYVHRTFIFPFRMRIAGKRTPLLIPLLAILWNVLNAYINAMWISHFGTYAVSWLTSPAFLGGAALFLVGFAINFHSDSVLFNLRKPGETGYKVPRGGLYRWVSSPNYLGEILEWLGWAMLTWSWAGLAFAAYTVANLAPRALTNHRWYRETFADYPEERRALIPYVV